MAWGASSIARTPGADSYHFTVIPLPVVPDATVTMQRRADAIAATYTGHIQDAVDLYRLSVEADGWMCGIMDTMARGILGLPLTWQGGSPEMRSALMDVDGTPGDFARMHPRAECAKIFRDGLGLGFGLGQYVLMCWRCDGIEWWRVPGTTDAHQDDEVCKRCLARRMDRPPGRRELFQLRWRDARWLWRNPITLQWRYSGRQGQVDITPGDGEWFLFQTVPDIDIWRHGPWVWGTIAAIFARDSTFDRQNTSAVCAPTHVFQAKGATDPKTRADVEQQAQGLAFGNKIILPGEWSHDIHAAKAEFVDVTASIVDWASDMWEVGLTGNIHGRKAATGFANMDVFARTTRDHRAYFAGLWIEQVRAQGLVWWARANFGTDNAPVGDIDTRSPEEKKAIAEADEQEGKTLVSLVDGYAATGYEMEPAYIEERAQHRGVRIRPIAKPVSVPGAPGTPPGTPGLSGDATAAPAPPSASNAAAPAPSAPPARLPEDNDPDEDDDNDAARLAADMNALGATSCRHRITTRCERCGVKASYRAVRGDDGAVVYRATWRAIRGASARLGASELTALAQAEANLVLALAALDALGPEPDEDEEGEDGAERARFSADQPRGPDGKFISGGGGATHDQEGRPIVTAQGTKHGFGRSKAADIARKRSAGAQDATAKAKAGGSHQEAAKAHQEAAEQHREAAKRSVRADYKAAHEAAAKAHEELAKAHAAEHAKTTQKKPPAAPKPPALPDAKELAADIHTRGVPALHEAAAKLKTPQEAKALDLALGKEAKQHEGDRRGILEESAGWFHYHANLIGTDRSEEGQRTNKADRDSQERSITKLHQRILRGST